MMKRNLGKLILSSLLILLPIPLGLIFWDRLPESINVHWGLDGAADGFASRPVAVFLLPILLLAIHLLCLFITFRDRKNENQSTKVFGLIWWIIPVISLFCWGTMALVILEKPMDARMYTFLLLGILFVIFGNYMPKCTQNHTIGIKISWTLASEENWNATHRFAGKVWVIGGLVLLGGVFLPVSATPWVLTVSILLLAVLPMAYSGFYYKKQAADGRVPAKPIVPGSPKGNLAKNITFAVVLVTLAVLIVFLFTTDFSVHWDDTSFTLESAVWDDLTVEYAAITELSYQENEAALRLIGFGSPHLSIGSFENDSLGIHTRFTYTGCDSCVKIAVGEKVLILNGRDEEATRAIYENLLERTKQTKEAAE